MGAGRAASAQGPAARSPAHGHRLGGGDEIRQPLGLAVVGGLVVSQLLTLYITPVIYLTLEGLARMGTRTGEHGPPSDPI